MSKVVEKIVNGDVRTVSRLIRDIDDEIPEVRETLKELYAHTGNAYVIGITGSPGVGKSTLVDQIIRTLRRREKTVGILAVDPTSPFSGGAILGDRVRMQQHATDKGVFIRSMATRGYFGGLTQSTRSAVDVLDAMGKEFIIIETVGVGQDEVDVAKSAHTTVIVVIPGMGDDIQAIKAGILEAGDIFAINKADREGVEKTFSHLRMMIDMNQRRFNEKGWTPPILKMEALHDKGIVELVEEIENHKNFIKNSDVELQTRNKKERIRDELIELVKNRIIHEVLEQLTKSGEFEKAINSVAAGKIDPYSACDNLVLPKLNQSK
jgi:LAO/AO transport system kinase